MQRRNPRAYSHARQGEVALFLAIVDRYVTAIGTLAPKGALVNDG